MSIYPGLGTKEMMAPKSSLVKKQVFGLTYRSMGDGSSKLSTLDR